MFLFVLLTLTYIRTKQEKKPGCVFCWVFPGALIWRGDSLFSNVGYPVNICLENYSMECCDRKPVRFYSIPRIKFFFIDWKYHILPLFGVLYVWVVWIICNCFTVLTLCCGNYSTWDDNLISIVQITVFKKNLTIFTMFEYN